MNRWMSSSLPNLFNKNGKGGKGKSSGGSKKGSTMKLDMQHARLFEYLVNIERDYTALFGQLDAYHLENARLRDTGDEVSMLIAQLSKDSAGASSKKNLEELGKQLALVEDHRNAEVQRLKAKVLDPLSAYGLKFKALRTDMRLLAKAVSRESRARQKLDRLQMKGMAANAVKLDTAKRGLQDAANDVANRKKTVSTTVADFERVRLTDLQAMLRDFVHVEMLFHAKILNSYTTAWQAVRNLKPDDDLNDFRKSFLQTEASGASAGATSQLVDASFLGGSAAGQTASVTADYSDEEDEDYDDEEEDYDEDEDEDETTTASARPSGAQASPAFVKRTVN